MITTNQRDPHDPAAGTDPERECLNTLDVTPPSSAVAALPAQLPRGGLVRWGGTDAGSGIASYDLYVSEEGGAWRPWLERTALTSSPLLGTVGYPYRFYSVARDNVGLVEAAPAVADAETVLVEPTPVLAVELAGNQVAIRFIAESGKRYSLEQRQELDAGWWAPVPGYQNLEGIGEQRVLFDILPGTPQKFYRLLISSAQ